MTLFFSVTLIIVFSIQGYLIYRVICISKASARHDTLFFWKILNTPFFAPPNWQEELQKEPHIKKQVDQLRVTWRRLTVLGAVLMVATALVPIFVKF